MQRLWIVRCLLIAGLIAKVLRGRVINHFVEFTNDESCAATVVAQWRATAPHPGEQIGEFNFIAIAACEADRGPFRRQ